MNVSPVTIAFAAAVACCGCFARTAAEDPLPGPIQTGTVYAMEDGGSRRCTASVLLTGREADAIRWFTDANLVERWLAEHAETPAEPNSPLTLSWPSESATWNGRLVERVADQGLIYQLEPFGFAGPTTLIVTFGREAGLTRVIIDQGPFGPGMDGEALADSHRAAWVEALAVLRSAHDRRLPTTPAPPPHQPPPSPASEAASMPGSMPATYPSAGR